MVAAENNAAPRTHSQTARTYLTVPASARLRARAGSSWPGGLRLLILSALRATKSTTFRFLIEMNCLYDIETISWGGEDLNLRLRGHEPDSATLRLVDSFSGRKACGATMATNISFRGATLGATVRDSSK